MTASTFVVYIPYEEEDEDLIHEDEEADRLLFKDELIKNRDDEIKASILSQSFKTSSSKLELNAIAVIPCNQHEPDKDFSERSGLLDSDSNSMVMIRMVPEAARGEATQGGRLVASNNESLPRTSKQARFDVKPALSNSLGTDACAEALSRRPSAAHVAKAADMDDLPEVTTEVLTLRRALSDLLDRLGIHNDVWVRTDDGNQWQVNFVLESAFCDKVLHTITAAGFGRISETSVSVFPGYHYSVEQSSKSNEIAKSDRVKSDFMKSIKSRLTVAQVVVAVKSNAELTFDFLVLILLASIIAGLGLAESSSVALVASMLISPLMGPIIGFTFGVVVKNRELWLLGVRNELIGLSVCLSYGFLFGLVTGAVNNSGALWGADAAWPTSEMRARGMLRSLWVGVLIALPSGAGVALSILGGNTGSLVGVAISASLLPPAVNAGMLWGLAVVSAMSQPPYEDIQHTNFSIAHIPPDCPALKDNTYKFVYVCSMPGEAAALGAISLLLTILNILCIFIMGIIFLKIKEIAPHTAMSPATEAFWKKDIPVVRNSYKTIKGRDCVDMAKLAKQLTAELRLENPGATLDTVMEELENDPCFNEVMNKTPLRMTRLMRHMSYESTHGRHNSLRQQSDPMQQGDQSDHWQQGDQTLLDHKYHTVINGAAAQRLSLRSPAALIEHTDKVKQAVNARGSVIRMRLRSQDSCGGESAPSGPAPLGGVQSAEGPEELVMVNTQQLFQRQRSQRHSARQHSGGGRNRFVVKPIEEEEKAHSSDSRLPQKC